MGIHQTKKQAEITLRPCSILVLQTLIIIIIIKIIKIIIIISLFNEDAILGYRLSNIWSSTMKLVQICLKTYIQYNKYTLFTF